MRNARQTYRFLYQKTNYEEAKLLRVYGTAGAIELPERIGGIPLAEIGPYCFSSSSHFEESENIMEEIQETDEVKGAVSSESLRELCGDYIRSIRLPDSVRRIGNCAFYNCRAVREIELGEAAVEIGSDAFMNCRQFKILTIRSKKAEMMGLKRILSQISSEIEVCFKMVGKEKAAIIFPEYSESYDEIAPAHLFGRNITGEGFRARQCFREGAFDFAAYDLIFEKACVNETEETLLKIAGSRLRYPVGLSEAAKEKYIAYMKAHAKGAVRILVREKNLNMLQLLCQEQLLAPLHLDEAVELAVRAEWTVGAARLINWKRAFIRQNQEDSYEFDDF